MKKLVFLSMFITSIAFSQVTDENGTTAVGTSSTTLIGNIGIGLTSPSLPQLMLAIGDSDTGLVGSNNTLNFYTGNTSKVTVNNAGNFGIGTTNPTEKLEVNGNIKALNSFILNDQEVSAGIKLDEYNHSLFIGDVNNQDISTYIIGYGTDENANSVIKASDGYISFDIEQATIMHMEGGEIGIGTSSPTEKLEVDGTVKAKKIVIESPSNGILAQFGDLVSTNLRNFNFSKNATSGNLSFSIQNTNNVTQFDVVVSEANPWVALRDYAGGEIFKAARTTTIGSFLHMPKSDSRLIIGDFGGYLINEGHKFVVKEGSALIEGNILTNSKIGVGVSSADIPADYKMAVAGKIISEEVLVKLQNTWPDYVFNNDYSLPTLQEVEDHIKTNGHLINIPTAKEVEEKGLLLGEMNSKLLEKIEELTLYTIQQQKELEAQKEKNNQLEARLSKIETLLSNSEKE